MSGIEIVGLVLGSIPLIISTLEHYKGGLQVMVRWRKYERELQSLIRNLETEKAKLQNACEKLLDGLVSPSSMEKMVENPLGDLWRKTETQRKIRARLWRDYNIFEQTVTDMQSATKEMMEKLGAGADGNWSSKTSISRELKKASFALSRSHYADLMSTIKNAVTDIESLATGNIELEPKRRVRSRLSALGLLRDVSLSIYRAICTSLACSCKHTINLRLSACPIDVIPGDNEEEIIRDHEFHLILSSKLASKDLTQASVPGSELEEIVIRANVLPSAPIISSSHSGSVTPFPSTFSKHKGKSVKFASFRSCSTTSTVRQNNVSLGTSTLSVTTAIPTHKALLSYGNAFDLCHEIKSATKQKPGYYYGTITDQAPTKPRSYSVHSPIDGEGDKMNNRQMISLWDILKRKGELVPPTYKERYELAVILASSVLQLYKTPWLPGTLTSQNVFFIQKSKGLDYGHAFILANDTSVSRGTSFFPAIPSPTLQSLGILLIELICAQTLESLRTPSEVLSSSPDLVSDYITAKRMLKEVNQASSNYGSAVTRCIDGGLVGQEVSFDDEKFRHEMYSGIVALLEENLRYL